MHEARPDRPAMLRAAEMILDLPPHEAAWFDTLIDVASSPEGRRDVIMTIDNIFWRSPGNRLPLREQLGFLPDNSADKEQFRQTVRAAQHIFGIVSNRMSRSKGWTEPLQLSLQVQQAFENVDPSFALYRERLYACRQHDFLNKPTYYPYLCSGLIIGLAFFAASNSPNTNHAIIEEYYGV